MADVRPLSNVLSGFSISSLISSTTSFHAVAHFVHAPLYVPDVAIRGDRKNSVDNEGPRGNDDKLHGEIDVGLDGLS